MLRKIGRGLVYGGHLLSLGGSGIVVLIAILLQIDITLDFLLLSYLLPQVAYTFNRWVEFTKDDQTNFLRNNYLRSTKSKLPLLFFFYLVLSFLISYYYGTYIGFLFVVMMATGSVLYTLYFKSLTKNLIGFKTLYVSFFWSLLTFLTVLYYGLEFSSKVWFIFWFIFLRFYLSTAYFDIKDIQSDRRMGLKTLPVVLGRKNTIILLHFLNILSLVPIVWGVSRGYFADRALILVFLVPYAFFYIEFARKKRDLQKISYVMVDGEYILWPLLICFSYCLL